VAGGGGPGGSDLVVRLRHLFLGRFSFCSLLALRLHSDGYNLGTNNYLDMAASQRDHKTTREDTSDRRIHTYISISWLARERAV
jgi:hypothetical protein